MRNFKLRFNNLQPYSFHICINVCIYIYHTPQKTNMTMEDQPWFLNPSFCHHDVKGPVAPTRSMLPSNWMVNILSSERLMTYNSLYVSQPKPMYQSKEIEQGLGITSLQSFAFTVISKLNNMLRIDSGVQKS